MVSLPLLLILDVYDTSVVSINVPDAVKKVFPTTSTKVAGEHGVKDSVVTNTSTHRQAPSQHPVSSQSTSVNRMDPIGTVSIPGFQETPRRPWTATRAEPSAVVSTPGFNFNIEVIYLSVCALFLAYWVLQILITLLWLLHAKELPQRSSTFPSGFRRVRLLQSDRSGSPLSWGIFRPVIVVPSDWIDWPVSKRRAVLTHELAHIHRYDTLWLLISSFICCLFWAIPFVWLVHRRIRVEAEQACDDAVINQGVSPTDYASQLLSVATTETVGYASSMAAKSMLSKRIRSLLDVNTKRMALRLHHALLVFTLNLAIIVPVGFAQLAYGATTSDDDVQIKDVKVVTRPIPYVRVEAPYAEIEVLAKPHLVAPRPQPLRGVGPLIAIASVANPHPILLAANASKPESNSNATTDRGPDPSETSLDPSITKRLLNLEQALARSQKLIETQAILIARQRQELEQSKDQGDWQVYTDGYRKWDRNGVDWIERTADQVYQVVEYSRTSEQRVLAPANYEQIELDNLAAIERIVEGAERDEVLKDLGPADFHDTYGDNVDVYYYRTTTSKKDGYTSKLRETTPLLFVEHKLISWGEYVTNRRAITKAPGNWQEVQRDNDQYIRQLRMGATDKTVLDKLGKPSFIDEIGDKGEIWFYRTHQHKLDGVTHKYQETTPLVFIDSALIAIDFGDRPS